MNLKIVLADTVGSVGAILLGGTSVLCVCGAIEYRMPWMLVPAVALGLLAWPCVRMAMWADEQRSRESMSVYEVMQHAQKERTRQRGRESAAVENRCMRRKTECAE